MQNYIFYLNFASLPRSFSDHGTKKQTFDPHALTREVVSATHEVVTVPFRLRTYRVIRKILIIFIAVSIVNVVFANVFYTPKMYRILRENSELVFKYRLLQDKIRAEQRKLDEIHHRDNFVYRALFSADTLNIGGIYTPYPASKYAALAGDEYAPLMIGTWQQLDAFGRQLYRTSVSFDELQILAKNKENMSTAIPAIWPIDRQALRRVSSRSATATTRSTTDASCTKASTWRPTSATTSMPRATRRYSPPTWDSPAEDTASRSS